MAANMAALMLRRNSRKDLGSLGTLFSQWSGRNPRADPMRRMTMGGAGPVTDAQPTPPATPSTVPPAFMDAFCAVQLTSSASISKQESGFLLSPSVSLGAPLLTPTASLKEGATAAAPDGTALLSPTTSKGGLEAMLASSPSFRATAEALLAPRASAAGVAAPSPLAISS